MHPTPSSTRPFTSGDFTPQQRVSAIKKAAFGKSVIRNAMNRKVRGMAMAVKPLKEVGFRSAKGIINLHKFNEKRQIAAPMPADGANDPNADPKKM
jgi:hypothetical protein